MKTVRSVVLSMSLIVLLTAISFPYVTSSASSTPQSPPRVIAPSPNGCWLHNTRTNVWNTLGCANSNTAPMSSLNAAMNCNVSGSNRCFLGLQGTNTPASALIYGISASDLSPTKAPGTQYTTPFASFWVGAESSQQNVLIQSGVWYGNTFSSSTPTMWVELVGPFTWNGLNCNTQFCGATHAVSVGDTIEPFEYWTRNCKTCAQYWYATAYDATTGVDLVVSINVANGLYYGYATFEGYELTSLSMLPSSPLNAYDVQIYSQSGTASNIGSPALFCQSCGSGNMGMTVSYSAPNVQWSW